MSRSALVFPSSCAPFVSFNELSRTDTLDTQSGRGRVAETPFTCVERTMLQGRKAAEPISLTQHN